MKKILFSISILFFIIFNNGCINEEIKLDSANVMVNQKLIETKLNTVNNESIIVKNNFYFNNQKVNESNGWKKSGEYYIKEFKTNYNYSVLYNIELEKNSTSNSSIKKGGDDFYLSSTTRFEYNELIDGVEINPELSEFYFESIDGNSTFLK